MSVQNEILREFNKKFDENFVSYSDLIDFLNEEFEKKTDKFDDVQEAYDFLDFEYHGFIGKHFVFFSDDSPWHVISSDDIPPKIESDLIESFNSFYSSDCSDLEELTSSLENKVMKAMSNVGCDPKTALQSILDDIGGDENQFAIEGFNGPYKLGLL